MEYRGLILDPYRLATSNSQTSTDLLTPSNLTLIPIHANMPKMNFHATGFVGEDRRVYEDGDQKNTPKKALEELNRTHFVNLAEAEHKDPSESPRQGAYYINRPITDIRHQRSGPRSTTASLSKTCVYNHLSNSYRF
jgi:hypothetical protein